MQRRTHLKFWTLIEPLLGLRRLRELLADIPDQVPMDISVRTTLEALPKHLDIAVPKLSLDALQTAAPSALLCGAYVQCVFQMAISLRFWQQSHPLQELRLYTSGKVTAQTS